MIIDKNLIFDSAAAITTTRDSINIIDLSQARDIGISEDSASIDVIIQVATAIVSATTTATLIAAVNVSTDNSTYTVAAQTDGAGISTASLLAGVNILNIQMPARRLLAPNGVGGDAVPRYIKIIYTASATFSSGNITAWLGAGKEANTPYPSGFTVNN